MIQADPNFIHRLPAKFLPENDRTVQSTPARSSEPVNAEGLPDPAGHPHTLNQPQMFTCNLLILTDIFYLYIQN